MEPFGSERGCTRRCGAHFKQFLAGLVYQNAPKSITNWPTGRSRSTCKAVRKYASFGRAHGLTASPVGIKNTIFCAH
eukprot:gene20775-biopygen17606